MSKIVVYTLSPDGTIPDYVSNGGHFAVPNEQASPQDWDMVGIVDDDAPQAGFATASDLADYFASLTPTGWTYPDGEPFDPVAFANHLWQYV